jgi:mono/diheme cytochrome c family protein
MRTVALLILIMTVAIAAFAVAGDGEWLKNVPDKDRARSNPLVSDSDAVAAGGKLYRDHCKRCHGADGQGIGGKPSVRSDRVQSATPGELEWLLRNGSLKNGMPSWSSMPEPQRWQMVSYVKSLGKAAPAR